MNVLETELPGVVVFRPRVFSDSRGRFLESWSAERYAEYGLPASFVQDNVSVSARGVLRGLHLQNPRPQGKLVTVLRGEVFDVAVDVRRGSPTYGNWTGRILSDRDFEQMYVPPGFAHGFQALSSEVVLSYKCSDVYVPEAEISVAWNDPDLAIEWPLENPCLSAKDAAARRLSDFGLHELPAFLGSLAGLQ